jgi:L-methionine (R)-S-oxide reductase
MNFEKYLELVGLEELVNSPNLLMVNELVELASRIEVAEEGLDLDRLYKFFVPKLGEGGACSVQHELESEPYDLSKILGNDLGITEKLYRLNKLVQELNHIVEADWLGIYFKVQNLEGVPILLKHAYLGEYSRAEFPLTENFAQISNNSTVGLTGKVKIVEDVASYAGPYYNCDVKVRSEFCCPILNQEGKVIGIIDAESFQPNYFSPEKLIEIAKVCYDLGK